MRTGVCTTDQAWQVYDMMISDDRFAFQAEPADMETRLRELTQGFPFSPKLWQDAYLAAFAMRAGFRLVTFDGGFRKFTGLDSLVLAPK
jgi:predicted nucleic acid-binding protein